MQQFAWVERKNRFTCRYTAFQVSAWYQVKFTKISRWLQYKTNMQICVYLIDIVFLLVGH